ncbi:MAG: hypothetical protein P1P77_16605, partial [Spirochaetaceae bacterium]|nr:hypothetical protein [Spirochaetaceae bacterium]
MAKETDFEFSKEWFDVECRSVMIDTVERNIFDDGEFTWMSEFDGEVWKKPFSDSHRDRDRRGKAPGSPGGRQGAGNSGPELRLAS